MPTRLRVLHGETRPSRVGTGELQPREAPVIPPPWFRPEAQAQWDALVDELGPMGLATSADRFGMSLLAEAINARAQLSDVMFRSPPIVKGVRTGREVVANPAWGMWRRHATVEHRLLAEFGLTPAARASMRFGWHPLSPEDAALEGLLTQPRGPA